MNHCNIYIPAILKMPNLNDLTFLHTEIPFLMVKHKVQLFYVLLNRCLQPFECPKLMYTHSAIHTSTIKFLPTFCQLQSIDNRTSKEHITAVHKSDPIKVAGCLCDHSWTMSPWLTRSNQSFMDIITVAIKLWHNQLSSIGQVESLFCWTKHFLSHFNRNEARAFQI